MPVPSLWWGLTFDLDSDLVAVEWELGYCTKAISPNSFVYDGEALGQKGTPSSSSAT